MKLIIQILSLKTAIENYDKIKLKDNKKYLVLGDMLELGKHSLRQHKLMSGIINKTKIDQVYVVGNHIKETFYGLKTVKKAKILDNNYEIISLINESLNNNDYLMVKGSNATGLNKIITNLKKFLMLFELLLSYVDTFTFLNVFKYITFRTGLAFLPHYRSLSFNLGPFIKLFSTKKFLIP